MAKDTFLSIIIPAYNEEHRLPRSLKAIARYGKSKRLSYEVLVVDDGSTDRTRKVVTSSKMKGVRLLYYGKNKGKGYAVRYGMMHAKGRLLLFSDADLSTPIEELEKFWPLLERYDVVIGSRNLKRSDIQVEQPGYRQIPGKLFSIITRLTLLPGIKDSQCGFKLFTRRAARQVFPRQRTHGFGFDTEVLFIARRLGYRIREVPIIWRNDGESKVRLLKDATLMLLTLMQVRWNSLLGRYR